MHFDKMFVFTAITDSGSTVNFIDHASAQDDVTDPEHSTKEKHDRQNSDWRGDDPLLLPAC